MSTNQTPKFQAGDWVQARNGRGPVYLIEAVEVDGAVTSWGQSYRPGTWYYLSNGAVHVAKRARSGWHSAEKADKGFRKVD